MKTPVTQEKTRRRHGRIGAQQNGPEPVREHQPGPSPTEAMTIGRGAHMVPAARQAVRH